MAEFRDEVCGEEQWRIFRVRDGRDIGEAKRLREGFLATGYPCTLHVAVPTPTAVGQLLSADLDEARRKPLFVHERGCEFRYRDVVEYDGRLWILTERLGQCILEPYTRRGLSIHNPPETLARLEITLTDVIV